MKTIDESTKQRFTSRIGLLLSALGVAVGTGNIWRFPRIAAQEGGESGSGAFLIAWVVFLFMWSIPLIIAEYSLGRKHRMGVIGVFTKAMGKKFGWVGAFVAFVTIAIAGYYAVIVGWTIYYLFKTATAPLPMSTEESFVVWDALQNSGGVYLVHILALLIATFVIWKGIRSIELANKVLIPSLLLIVLISVIRAVTLPGASEGIAHLFHVDLSQLRSPQLWLAALTQNAWDTGAGWGLFLTYAAYMKMEHGAVKNAFITAIGNNTVSILAGIMVFGTVFAILGQELNMSKPEVIDIMQSSGPASTGLTLIWMPQLFARMFLGRPLAILFFTGLLFAALTSLIAMIELATRLFVDFGLKRKHAVLIIVPVIYLIGLPSARNVDFLSNQDFVWGIGLMISGSLVAWAVMKSGVRNIRAELNAGPADWHLKRWWELVIRFFIPFATISLLIWWFYLAATVFAKGDWYNPLNPYSIMTCICQWAIMVIIFVILNKRIVKSLV